MTICILGAPRNGTSLTTKIMNILGVYLGSSGFENTSDQGNPTGYWEHRLIHKLNEDILSRFGGGYHRPPSLPSDLDNSPDFEYFQKRAQAIIQAEFSNEELWGWKQPITCLLLPLWQKLIPSMRYVICLRDPFDCISSQCRLFNSGPLEGLYVWLLYLKLALRDTMNKPRILISMEAWVNDSESQLRSLAEFLGQPVQPDVECAVQAFIDKRLWHTKTAARESENSIRHHFSNVIITAVERVYENLSENGLNEPEYLDSVFQQAIEIVEKETREVWIEQLNQTSLDLQTLISHDEAFILVDQDELRPNISSGSVIVPFLEHDGHYWGVPADSEAAIQELERLLHSNVSFIVFAQPAFWWLDYFDDFRNYLHSRFSCILDNSRLVVFDLRL